MSTALSRVERIAANSSDAVSVHQRHYAGAGKLLLGNSVVTAA